MLDMQSELHRLTGLHQSGLEEVRRLVEEATAPSVPVRAAWCRSYFAISKTGVTST